MAASARIYRLSGHRLGREPVAVLGLGAVGQFATRHQPDHLRQAGVLSDQVLDDIAAITEDTGLHPGLVVRRDDGRYALGVAVERLQRVRSASVSVSSVVMPVLRDLAAATGESASFHVRQGEQRLCLLRVDSPRPVRDHLQVGALLPLHQGAAGRVLLAFSGAKGAMYARIRRDGVAVLAGALSLSMPAQRLLPSLADPVQQAARRITLSLGGEVP